MEGASGTCDAFSRNFCTQFAAGQTPNVPIDTCTMSTIHAFLAECEGKRASISVNAQSPP